MLKFGRDLDANTCLWMILTDYLAYDPETECYLSRSRGNRKAGRPTRYWLGKVPGCDRFDAVRFTAWTDEESLVKANALLRQALEAQ